MTQDEIIRMAREAGISSVWVEASTRQLERFTALVAEPWIETNKALAKEIIELKKQAEQEPVAFKFVRYVDGKEMAEGVTIEREKTLDAAIKKAVVLCPNRNKTVLVYAAPQPVKQEPVAWTATRLWNRKDTWKCSADIEKDLLYAAPVRTKDLTDDEVAKAYMECTGGDIIARCRAVIAADREKNK